MPNGNVKVDSQLVEDDDARWVERTGWAPKPGFGIAADTDGETALDHQTWLESNLDDQYFGGKPPRLGRRIEIPFILSRAILTLLLFG